MKPIYKAGVIFPSVNSIEIFEPVINDDDSYYPITLNDKSYHLKMNDGGFWEADGLSEELCLRIGDIVERHKL